MSFRFSVRALLLVTAIAAFVALLVVASKQQAVNRTPLEWEQLQPERLKTILETDHPVLIYGERRDLTKQLDVLYYLEHSHRLPEARFRQFVHNHGIELLRYDYTEPNSTGSRCAAAIQDLLKEQYPEFPKDVMLIPTFVIALPGHKRLHFFRSPSVDGQDVMAAVLSNGRTRDGNLYFRTE